MFTDLKQAEQVIAVLVEKLGGHVTITESELLTSMYAQGGTLYAEPRLDTCCITIEVLPPQPHEAETNRA